jgi:hypothetical protein
MPKTENSDAWKTDAVLQRLGQRVASGRPVACQVFVADDVPAAQVPETAHRIVAEASEQLNLPPGAIHLGKIRGLAKSFSVTTDVPEAFEAIARQRTVKGIMEAEQLDILPQPVRRKAVL